MSGIYIPGMKMPREGFVEILIRDDGTVQQMGQTYRIDGNDYYRPYVSKMPVVYKAIPVPNHGRLKDYDQIMKEYHEWFNKAESREYESMFYALYGAISDARIIIPGR